MTGILFAMMKTLLFRITKYQLAASGHGLVQ
jgi:hypothetical protein